MQGNVRQLLSSLFCWGLLTLYSGNGHAEPNIQFSQPAEQNVDVEQSEISQSTS